VAAGENSRLAVTSTGRVYAWGDNSSGQLCLGGANFRAVPTLVPGLTHVKAVASSGEFTYVLENDGAVWGCGEGLDGALGASVAVKTSVPVALPLPKKVTAIATSVEVGYAVSGGQVWALGNDEFGGLGDGLETYGRHATPSLVKKLSGAVQLASTGRVTLAVLSSGKVESWGLGADLPTPVAVLTKATEVAVDGLEDGLYALQDGHVWQWGNTTGALGTGHPDNQSTPVEVPYPKNVIGLGSGYQTTFAIAQS
jgi:alpha-tubulin suppressor-like RCC1 family protein